uniref:Thyroglobulin type-1 domain-containing protein n=1 Tax=Gouania willdenowi TaxID=441366 RepID=A0A8C5DL08_GOUWI
SCSPSNGTLYIFSNTCSQSVIYCIYYYLVKTIYTWWIKRELISLLDIKEIKIIDNQLCIMILADTRLSLWIVENSLNQHEDATSKSQLNVSFHTIDTDVEKVLMELLQDLELPQFNETFSGNLLSLNQQMNESMWKSFETWMQNWLIFQKAQQMVSVTKTKCQIEAQTAVGPYKPQCRSWGEYMQKQCYGSTGYCWCVDVVSGKRIKDTLKHGDPECWRVTRATHKNHVMDEDYGELMIN